MSTIKLTRVQPGLYTHGDYEVERVAYGIDDSYWCISGPGVERRCDTLDEARAWIASDLAKALRTAQEARLDVSEVAAALVTGTAPACATGVLSEDHDWCELLSVVAHEVTTGVWQDENEGGTFRWDTTGRNDWWPGRSLAQHMAAASAEYPPSQAPF